jgi:hypothetical protein
VQAEAAIGEFALGESPVPPGVTTRPAFDWFATVISQYANSPVLLKLIENFAGYIDPTRNIDEFFRLLWNVDTAQGYGLDVWGRIVGVSRVLFLPATGGEFLGFEEAGDAFTLGHAPFFSVGGTLTENFTLSDAAYRRLIFAKALANISDGSIPSINQILINLFSEYGNCYVVDNNDMTLTYTFGSELSPVDFAIVTQSGVLPRPAGVTATIDEL